MLYPVAISSSIAFGDIFHGWSLLYDVFRLGFPKQIVEKLLAVALCEKSYI